MLVSVPGAVAIPVAVGAIAIVAIAVRAFAVTISGSVPSRCDGTYGSGHARWCRPADACRALAVAIAAVVGIALIGAFSVRRLPGFAGGPNRIPIGSGPCRTVR
jgi:hypothetical protein